MKIVSIACAPLDNRCYVIWDAKQGARAEKSAVVIDPSMAFEEIMALAEKEKLNIELIINTHGHHDHMFHNFELKQATGAALCINWLDEYRLEKNAGETRPWLPRAPKYQKEDFVFKHSQVLKAGGVELKVFHTPGHTEGSSCFELLADAGPGKQDEKTLKTLFTGDTLFKGTFGRTDFPGGNEPQMWQSLKTISEMTENYRVLPGHSEETTLDWERAWMKKLVEEKKAQGKL